MTDESGRMQTRARVSEDGAAPEDTLVVSREVIERFSHRLRSMLTSMSAAAEYLLDTEPDTEVAPGAQTEMLGIISEQTGRIEDLLDDFLVVTTESGEHRLSGTVVDLYHVSREAVRALAAGAQSVGAWLVFDAAGGASTVFGHRSLLRQAVAASLRAMINLTRPGDRVVARLRHIGDAGPSSTIEFAVTLESENDRFRDGMATINPTDLSLDAVRHICEHHGGTFSMMQERPGVICRLPAAPMHEGPLSAAGDALFLSDGARCIAR